jgi:hypothetical protein
VQSLSSTYHMFLRLIVEFFLPSVSSVKNNDKYFPSQRLTIKLMVG